MQAQINDSTAPILLSYRKVIKKPNIKLDIKFVGLRQLLANAVDRMKDIWVDVAYETTKEVIDPGESRVVHWALNVEEPWESGATSVLVASRVDGVIPGAALHFEIVSSEKKTA